MNDQGYDLPHDEGAERGILAAILATPDVLGDLAAILTVDSFYSPAHKIIFQTLLDIGERGDTFDTVSLASALEVTGEMRAVGGHEYLNGLNSVPVPPGTALLHAKTVNERAIARRLIEHHTRGIERARTGSGLNGTQALGDAQASLDSIVDTRISNSVVQLAAALNDTMDGMEARGAAGSKVTGIRTGFTDLDDMTSGLHPGQLIIVAGRPGSGKSTLGVDFALNASVQHNSPTLLCSLEMSTDEITMKILSSLTQIPLKRIRNGDLNEADWRRIGDKSTELYKSPLFLDDSPNNTISSIRTKARRLQQRQGLSLLIIDYAQLMSADGKHASREQEVSSISRGTKLLAKELGVPVVLMAQLNRQAESRTDKKPQVSDLRESGSLEQDADMVILVHREEMYDTASTRVGEADLIIGKQRNGPQGIVTLASQLHISRFANMANAPGWSE
ncbi:replicative DNA helicase [Tessaracoccus sp.]